MKQQNKTLHNPVGSGQKRIIEVIKEHMDIFIFHQGNANFNLNLMSIGV